MADDTARDQELRNHLVYLLRGGGAHIDFDAFVAELPAQLINKKIDFLPYTIWQVLEHMRIAQWDILEFSRNARHRSPPFPEGYWPPPDGVADDEAFRKTVRKFQSDLTEMEELVANPETDLFAAIPHGEGQTILREALLIADHNSYHLGALLVMRRIVTGSESTGG
ncbi:MAG: DinB family protein [Pyrinomonadaceae bacterium]